MIKNRYSVLGLMSGTSLDGLDIAHALFRPEHGKWQFQLQNGVTIPYDKTTRHRLKAAIGLSGLELMLFHREYGRWLGEQVKHFALRFGIEPDFVASHGHTVFHQKDKQLTFQLGAGQETATTSGFMTICDFRSKDVVCGGEGAPLVPIGDRLLFSSYDACLNIGGIANLSYEHERKRVAFDIGPANMLLNHLVSEIGLPYDDEGKTAASGTLHHEMLDAINAPGYFGLPYPKSLGYEWFVSDMMPVLSAYQTLPLEDRLCTAAHHIARQIANNIPKKRGVKGRLLMTGGGVRNKFLVKWIKSYTKDHMDVIVPDEKWIDFKEALVFALMGVLKIRNESNCLSSVTGASRDVCGGVIYYP